MTWYFREGDGKLMKSTDRGPRMNFKLIDFHTGPVNIERGEAINRLSERGISLDRAVSLIDALPAGVGIVYRDFHGDEYQIVRIG